MKDIKIATLKVNLKKGEKHKEALCAWLHEKAEEIKKIESKEYVKSSNFNFYI